MALYKITRTQYNSRDCLVCGLDNPFGLQAAFYETSDRQLIALFTPQNGHQSYPNRMHGGVIGAVLDETIGRAISIDGNDMVWGVTIELNVRYKKPVPLDAPLKVIGRITGERGNFFEGTAELILPDGTIAATAVGKYMRMALDKISTEEFRTTQWGLMPETKQPEYIEI